MTDTPTTMTSIGAALESAWPAIVVILGGSVPGALMAYFAVNRQLKEDKRRDTESNVRNLYYPLYDAALELFERIEKIKIAASLDWLDKKYLDDAMEDKGFAKDPREKGYFIFSSIYLFSKLFCWLEIIHQRLGYFYEPKKQVGDDITKAVANLSRAFQYKEIWNDCEQIKYAFEEDQSSDHEMKDAWSFHRQFQHSIGELLISDRENTSRCISFLEFFERYIKDDGFRYWFRPLEGYIIDVAGYQKGNPFEVSIAAKDLRLLRLVIVQFWLGKLILALGNGIRFEPAISPDDVLSELPDDLAQSVRSMDAELTDSFFSRGVKI